MGAYASERSAPMDKWRSWYMTTWVEIFHRIDTSLTRWMAKHGIRLLRISIGVIFFWFGMLKFFPGISPAEDFAAQTIELLTLGSIPAATALFLLAVWECLIGLGLIFGVFMRATLFLLFTQMLGTVTPLFLLPHEVFTHFPYALTLKGQYIVKNLVIISAAFVIGATVRGGKLFAEPHQDGTATGSSRNLI